MCGAAECGLYDVNLDSRLPIRRKLKVQKKDKTHKSKINIDKQF